MSKMQRYGLFRLGGFDVAIALGHLKKIVEGEKTHRLPALPNWLTGVLVDAGQLVPLIDLSALAPELNIDATGSYQIILDSEYGALALPAHQSGRITSRGESRLQAHADHSWWVGEYTYQGRAYAIVNIDYLARELAHRTGPGTLPQGQGDMNDEETVVGR